MPQTMPDPLPDLAHDVKGVYDTNFVAFASFTVLVWDHLITFSDEVEYIWKGGKGPIIYLFFFNRYFTPLAFVVNLFAYLSSSWTPDRCHTFVRYEGATVVIAIEVVALMMLIRINALYKRYRSITIILSVLLVIETVVHAYLIASATPVGHNSQVRSCSMVFNKDLPGVLTSASAWIPLLYDTIVAVLTICRTIPGVKHRQPSFMLRRILEDGLMYYSVILAITLVLAVMISAADPGIQNIAAQTQQLVTVAMMSRITISLRKAGIKQDERVVGLPYFETSENNGDIHLVPFPNRSHNQDARPLSRPHEHLEFAPFSPASTIGFGPRTERP